MNKILPDGGHLYRAIALLILLSSITPAYAENPIIITPDTIFEVNELAGTLDSILAATNHTKKKNIVFFIHGRGAGNVPHPKKSIQQLLPNIESEYDTKVVLFNWEGSAVDGRKGFPEEQARAASGDFFNILNQMAIYKHENVDRL